MPRCLTQYRVFIGSPSGLETERTLFRDILEEYTTTDAKRKGVIFDPVGWEDTIGGFGRPQSLINEDLKRRDYAVFVLHDRWGSPTGRRYSSGTEEEWKLAEKLIEKKRLRNMILFFRKIDADKLYKPDQQLHNVLEFRDKIYSERQYLAKDYVAPEHFGKLIRRLVAEWLFEHDRAQRPGSFEHRLDKARGVFGSAADFSESGEYQKAISAFKKVISGFGENSELKLRILVIDALFRTAAIYRGLGEPDKEREIFKEIVARLRNVTEDEPELRDRLNDATSVLNDIDTAADILS
jgi:tetratricopeptide (TPR) repeat protein